MRLIDADALIEKIHIMPDTANKFSFEHLVMTYAPTIDAVPVVRCRECKYHEDEEIGMVYCPNMIGGWVEENWFCADGEREDNNG